METKFELGPMQKQWIAALRSGKYEQGFRRLRTRDNKYCCLGVACEILGLEAKLDFDVYRFIDEETSSNSVIPGMTFSRLGLRSKEGHLKEPLDDGRGYCSCLYDLNDTAKLSFEQIADYIEANPENVFERST